MKLDTNYKHLLGEVGNLNWEERRELADVLTKGQGADSVVFDVKLASGSEENFIISSNCFNDSYLLTPASAKACLKEMERSYFEGMDAETYCGMQIALEKEKD